MIITLPSPLGLSAPNEDGVHFEANIHSEFIVLHRYHIFKKRDQFICQDNLHACILSESIHDRMYVMRRLMPLKFFFESCCLSHPISDSDLSTKTVVDTFCLDTAEAYCDSRLKASIQSDTFFDEMVDFLYEKTILGQNALIIAPSEWVHALRRNFKLVTRLLKAKSPCDFNWSYYL